MTRTPEPVSELKKQMPHAYAELERIRQTLEKHFKDVQDFEFTIERGTLYCLQTRNGKMNAAAMVRTVRAASSSASSLRMCS